MTSATRKLLLIAGLTLAWYPATAAVIVTVRNQEISERMVHIQNATRPEELVDVDGDGKADLRFRGQSYITQDVPTSGGVSYLSLAPQFDRDTQRSRSEIAYTSNIMISPGSLIGETIGTSSGTIWSGYSGGPAIISIYSNYIQNTHFFARGFGEAADEGYVGFRLPAEDGRWRYGYAHFTYNGWPDSGNLPIFVGYAYETELDKAIEVMPIPEASSSSLLAAGICLLCARRKKKAGHY